jgi:hypothetical protein
MIKKSLVLITAAVLISGCSVLIEPFRKIAGISVTEFRRGEKPKQTKVLNLGYNDCFTWVLAALKENKVVIHMQSRRRGYIIVRGIPGSIDTTKAAIFFKSRGDTKTEIEVISLSSNAVETVAGILFSPAE